MKIVAIVQARMDSTRLPGKVLMRLGGKTVLENVVNRLLSVPLISEVVIATTIKASDDKIVEEAKRLNVSFFRGDEEHVLSRYYEAAIQHHADIIVRVTSDCPVIDPVLTNRIIQYYIESEFDYVSNTLERTFPRGLDTEVFSIEALKRSYLKAYTNDHREHVTPYIYQHPNEFNIGQFVGDFDNSSYRWTLDTKEDYRLMTEIFNNLFNDKQIFYWESIIQLMKDQPQLPLINAHIQQKQLNDYKA